MLELLCLLIVSVWLGVRLSMARSRRRLLGRVLVVMILAWISEQSVISLYGFYAYADRWWVMLGDVPLTVVLIWPVVVLSARDVLRALTAGSPGWMALLALWMITADAAFIEPSAVFAGLWTWTVPGVFGVPLIGILGWGLFGAWMVFALERQEKLDRWELSSLVAIVPGLHLGLLALWWGGMRLVAVAIPDGRAALIGGAVAGLSALYLLKRGRRVPLPLILLRLPGALFFAALLAKEGPSLPLVGWLTAFSLPWLVWTARGWQTRFSRPF